MIFSISFFLSHPSFFFLTFPFLFLLPTYVLKGSDKVAPDVRSHTYLIGALTKGRNWQRALQAFDDMLVGIACFFLFIIMHFQFFFLLCCLVHGFEPHVLLFERKNVCTKEGKNLFSQTFSQYLSVEPLVTPHCSKTMASQKIMKIMSFD
jgi:pentatricopeptide repeat protein